MNAPHSIYDAKRASERSHVLSGLAAEVVFAGLPLLVVLLVVVHANHSHHLFSSPEWSFGAAILFGQSLVKFVSGISARGAAARGPVALLLALLVVLGLAPSLTFLGMTLQAGETKGEPLRSLQVCQAVKANSSAGYGLQAFQAAERDSEPARWLQFFQVAFFLLAAVMYMLLGTVGETWTKR